ncbi:LptA/OstA family protein [Deinococcus sp. HMF7604]|uniref:LptA/OstA family protein n=1 Tax=Deinococcus betulae TaxID=2873312 RepID=UPI001CCA66C2|nr:LptA/OstA family protein [Deinococcus betulae]MBZ9750032.1 LptA/OstA family protein [Deinococcus betulae]
MTGQRWTGAAGRVTVALLLGLGGVVWGQTQPVPSAPARTTTPQVPPEDLAPAPEQAGAEQSSLELVRRSEKDGKSRRILIVKTGTQDDSGVFVLCQPTEDDPEDAPTLAVFSETGTGGVRLTIDKNVITVPLAVVTQLPPKDGQEGSDGRVEASAGTARFLDEPPPGKTDRLSRCAVEATPKPAADTVLVTQGRTELRGQKLVYDSADGIARIDGPITFKRSSDKDALSGTSQRIEVSVDDEKTTLVGNVVLNSEGGRVSKAARVEYDDASNIARLYGTPEQPAQSVKGGDTLSAGTILYDLDRNEVRAVKPEGGTITGEFIEGEAAGTPSAVPPPATPPNP